jgi:hypothetical protein
VKEAMEIKSNLLGGPTKTESNHTITNYNGRVVKAYNTFRSQSYDF